jgi:glycosyltransferase involved in cell wall biosynthesis
VINAPDSNKSLLIKRAFNALCFACITTILGLGRKTDVLIASSGPITVGIPAMIIKWIKRIPLVFEVRDLWPQGAIELQKIKRKWLISLAKRFERTCYNHASLVVACSSGMEEGIKATAPDVSTICIPNAADLQLFSQKHGSAELDLPEILQNKKLFIYTGSLGLMDDCKQIVSAFSFLREKEDELAVVFIGDGAEKPDLMQMAKNSGFNSYHFTGLLPKHEVALWYSRAYASLITFKDVPVLQTVSPNKLFDSLAAAVPVIQTTQGWIRQTLERNDCGITVSSKNPAAFAQAIKELSDDTVWRNSMANMSRKLAESEFDMDKLSKQYLNRLMELTKN